MAALAGQQVGGVLVPLNTRFKGGEAADIVRRAGVRLAFAMGGFLGVDYASILKGQDCPDLELVVRLGTTSPEPLPDEFAALGEGVSEADLDARIEAVRPTDLSDILYTSGTTGAPKGVMTTHGQNIAVFEEWSAAVGLRAEDRYLVVNPFFPLVRVQGGLAGGTAARCDHLSGNPVRCRARAAAGGAPPNNHAARPAHAVPVAAGRTRDPQRRPEFATLRGDGRRGGAGATRQGHEAGTGIRRGVYGLWPHRVHGRRIPVPAGRRLRDHRQHLRAGHARGGDTHSRCAGRGSARRRAGRGLGAGLQRDAGVSRRPGSDFRSH